MDYRSRLWRCFGRLRSIVLSLPCLSFNNDGNLSKLQSVVDEGGKRQVRLRNTDLILLSLSGMGWLIDPNVRTCFDNAIPPYRNVLLCMITP